jgi:hypothetical protein
MFMLDIAADVEKGAMRDIDKAISLMITDTRRSGEDAVHRASYAFLVSAKANTPLPKGKNRRIKKDGAGNSYYPVWNQNVRFPRKVMIPAVRGTAARRAELRKLKLAVQAKYKAKPRYGAAKASWTRAFNDLGKAVKKTEALKARRIAMASRAKKVGVAFAPATNITNGLEYLHKIAPHVERVAMEKAGKKLLDMVEKGIEKSASRWR